MSGFFKTNREIFSHPIWHNILQFRLFFLIYGNAVHSKEGFRQTETLTLKRGQWQRSYDKLIDDLKYKENNTWKKYSKTTLQRNIKVMELNGLLLTSQHELGTIFTVVNYEKYQGFQEFSKSDLEQDLEQQRNSNGTVTEQQRNHKNNDNNVNNENNDNNKELTVVANAKPKRTNKKDEYDPNKYKTRKKDLLLFEDDVYMTSEEYDKLVNKYGKGKTDYMINYYNSYVIQEGYREDKESKNDYIGVNKWIAGGYGNYKENKINTTKQEKSDNAIIDFVPNENGLLRLEE